MILPAIKNKIEAIVNVFETGSPQGDYAAISIYKDGKNGSRQITFGRSQTTEQGNLRSLIDLYISNGGAFAGSFQPYLSQIGKTPLVDNADFKALLRRAAREDPLMRSTQDYFFDVVYYTPALHFFDGYKFTFPLSLLVIYDSFIQSGTVLSSLRQRFKEVPPSLGGNEKAWTTAYVNVRQDWLAGNAKAVVRNTVYRTRCFLEEIGNDNWMLASPVDANGTLVP